MHTIIPNPPLLAVFLVATTDHNNAFSDESLRLLLQVVQKTHLATVVRMQNADIEGTLREIKNILGLSINVLFICGHGSHSKVIFEKENGVYRIQDITKHHFKDLASSASIYFMSCNTANLARKITELTHLTTYAPNGESYTPETVLLPNDEGSFELIQYNSDLCSITEKHTWINEKKPSSEASNRAQMQTVSENGKSEKELLLPDPTFESQVACRRLTSLESLLRLFANAPTGNAAVLYVLGIHFLKGILIEKNDSNAFSYLYESARCGYFYAQRKLEQLYANSPEFFSIAAYYLALLEFRKSARESPIKGYEYLLQSTLNFYLPANNLLFEKAQQNDPLALFYLGNNHEARGDPNFLNCYLKSALLGEEKAYEALIKIYLKSQFPFIKGAAALYLGYILAYQNNPSGAQFYFTNAESLNTPGAKEALADLKKTTGANLARSEIFAPFQVEEPVGFWQH